MGPSLQEMGTTLQKMNTVISEEIEPLSKTKQETRSQNQKVLDLESSRLTV